MEKKGNFLIPLFMAIVMMAMCPMKMWAATTYDYVFKYTALTADDATTINGKFTAKFPNAVCTDYVDANTSVTVTFNAKINTLSSKMFQNCTGLTSMTIPENVPALGTYLFDGCTNLKSVSLPSTLTTIGNYAFRGCTSLASIDIPSNVTNIGTYVFQNCTSLETVEIPNGVKTIDKYTFNGCTKLASVTIPSTVTSIKESAFQGCSSLESVTIPSGVTTISQNTFQGCSKLSSVDIPSTVTSIGNSAFEGCTSLESINIPSNVSSIGKEAFRDCTNLTSVTLNSTTPPTMGQSVFFNSKNVQITVPSGSEEAYNSNTSWSNYKNLIKSYPQFTYTATADLSELFTAAYSDYEVTFSPAEFAANTPITVTVKGDVTTVPKLAFDGDDDEELALSLVSITIPEGVTTIEDGAFNECSNLESVTLPKSLKVIDECAFIGSTKLTTITIPEGVTTIGSQAFTRCGLTALNIPSSVTKIGNAIVSGCKDLATITVAEGNTVYQGVNNCIVSLKAVDDVPANTLITGCKNSVIPNTVTSIGEGAFEYCPGLTSIDIPHTVTSIGDYAFATCRALTSITIPSSVTSIGDEAFFDCKNLTTVVCEGATPASLGDDMFFYYDWDEDEGFIINNLKIYVPAASVDAYKTSWSDYADYIQAISATTNNSHFATYSAAFDWKVATADVKAYKVSVDGTSLVLTELTGYIPAGAGVLLGGDVTKVGIDAKSASDTQADMEGNELKATTNADGTLAAKPTDKVVFALGAEDKFLHYTATAFIHNRAYLEFDTDPCPSTSGAKAMTIVFADGDATVINNINSNPNVESCKRLENGRIMIIKNGIKYTTSGQVVK